ncbi:MAG: hypothetical protein ABSG21_08180 [Spirochaetia bacterium]
MTARAMGTAVAEESEEIHESDAYAENGCGDVDNNEPTHDE